MAPSRYSRKNGIQRYKKVFHIATEGEKHELEYFSAVRKKWESKAILKVYPTVEGKSAPKHVLHRILKVKKNSNKYDDYWIVVDVDRWELKGNLQSMVQDCIEHSIKLAISNPCFDYWLLLHFCDPGDIDRSKDCKKILGSRIPNGRKKYDPVLYLPKIFDAAKRAKILDKNPEDKWPQSCGSRIYLLIESIFPGALS